MLVRVLKADIPVCTVLLGCLSLAGVIIYDVRILNAESLPFSYKAEEGSEILKHRMRVWMESRILLNSTPDLDRKMQDLYGLDQVHYGRMYYYQHLGAFMAYLVSGKDEYWVTPVSMTVLSYALVDPHWTKGYLLEPMQSLQEAREKGAAFACCLRQ